jgi:Protein of unknown function (DUF1214)
VPNGLDRYSLGDRSNLTYSDGTQVYADPSSNDAFSILIQPADMEPSKNWTKNWLPAPKGGGIFTVNCMCCSMSYKKRDADLIKSSKMARTDLDPLRRRIRLPHRNKAVNCYLDVT